MIKRFDDWRRRWAFVRHIPLRQLARRFFLRGKWALADMWPWSFALPEAPPRALRPPLPVFAPRRGLVNGQVFTFLGRSRTVERLDGLDEPDLLWRMNLHYMEYLEAVDDERCQSLIESWIEANPLGRRGAWRDSYNAYALSLRVVVWMQQLARRNLYTPEIEARLFQQIRFLVHNLETDIGGNHLIKNIKALIFASAFFVSAEAESWRTLALFWLEKALKTQILPDGVHYERSPSYHMQVFADLLECRHVLADLAPPELDKALKAMAQVTADVVHPDGWVALFNDAGLNMAYASAECLRVFSKLYQRNVAPAAVFAYPHAGYWGWREEGDYFIADCGPLGPDALMAHAHGDILSFELDVGGLRFIVDQGVYEYVAGDRRAASRTAFAHNTLCFDGRDQGDFFGTFRCGRRPKTQIKTWQHEQNTLVLEGTHDAYAPQKHTRRFQKTKGALHIVDQLEGPMREAHVSFLLHPEVEVARNEKGLLLARKGNLVFLKTSLPLMATPAVWWPNMGSEKPTLRLWAAIPVGVREVRSDFFWTQD